MPALGSGAAASFACFFCLTAGSMRMRLDKKGRPYLRCGLCGTKSFLYEASALRGLMLWDSAVGQFIAQLQQTDLAASEQRGVEMVNQLAQERAVGG